MTIISALSISRRPAAAFIVIGFFWGVFAAYVPEMKAQLDVSDALFGVLLLGSATGLISSMWLAPRADRVLGGRGMQVGVGMLALLWLIPGQATTPLMFLVAMALVGLASGMLDVIMNARVSELEAQHSTSLMNANHAMFSIAYAGGAVISGVAREYGLPPVTVFAGFGVVTMILIPLIKLDPAFAPKGPTTAGRYPLWPIILCGSVVFIAFTTEAAVETWSAIHIERTLGGGAAQGALGPAMLGITMAFGRFTGQALTDQMSEIRIVVLGSLLAAVGALVAALAASPLVAYLGFGILGLGASVVAPMGLALIGQIVPPHMRTVAISRVAVIGFSGFFIAPMVVGLVSEGFGLRIAFIAVAGLAIMAVPLAMAIAHLRRRPQSV